MKHASRIPAPPLQGRIRRLGFNPDCLTATEQEEFVALEEILSWQAQAAQYTEPESSQRHLVSP